MRLSSWTACWKNWLFHVLLGFGVANANILHVPRDFEAIQLAIDSSENGDTILVAQGRYVEALECPSHDITIAGAFILSGDTTDIAATTISSPDTMPVLQSGPDSDARQIRIVGLRLAGNAILVHGIRILDQEFALDHCELDSFRINAGALISAQGCAVRIQSLTFRNNNATGSTLFELGNCTASFADCQFQDNAQFAQFFLIRDSEISLSECMFRENGSSSPGLLAKIEAQSSIALSLCKIAACSLQSLLAVWPQGIQVEFECRQSLIDSNAIAFDLLNLNGWASNSTVSFLNNTISNTTTIEGFGGLHMIALATSGDISGDVNGNLFLRNHRRQDAGVFIDDFGDFSATRNYFIENTTDGFLSLPGGPVMLIGNSPGSFRENIFHGNEGNAVDHFGHDEPGFAEHNYWGHASGPYNAWSNPDGLGDTVDTLIFYEPWEDDTLFLSAPNDPDVPITFVVGYPYPNPFNSSVTIEYALTREQDVTLEIYDILGRKVETLFDERQRAGVHSVLWKADGVASGLYIARLISNEGAARAVKLMLLK